MCSAAAEQPLPRGRGGWLGTHQLPLHFGEVAKGEIQSEFWQNLIVKSVESESSPRNISEVVPRSKIYGLIVQK